MPEHVKKRFAAAAAMLEEQAVRGRPAGAQRSGDDEGGERVAGDDTSIARGWDADECTSAEGGRDGGERDERRAEGEL